MNNGILSSAGNNVLDNRTLGTVPLNGNILNSCVTPYNYPATNNQYDGYKNGNDYVVVIDTTVNNSLTITMRLWLAFGALLTIDWGDGSCGATIPAGAINIRSGSFETLFLTTGSSILDISHTYSRHGQYIVKFMGIATTTTTSTRLGLGFLCSNITHILSFGKNNNLTICLQTNNNNLIYVPDAAPPQHLGNYGDNGGMFNGCSRFNSSNISKWNIDNATSLLGMFQSCSLFDQNIENWNTSNVTSMANTFYAASNFNQPLNNWNTGNVTSMSDTFRQTSLFNQPLNNWNTSNVTDMTRMFWAAPSFNQPLNNWNVRKVTNFTSMFQSATSFNSSLSGWALGADTAGTTCASMFLDAASFNQDIGNWDVSKVTNMSFMLASNTSYVFNNGGSSSINNWNTSNVTNMSYMFANNRVFNQPIGSWNVSKVQTMNSMLQNTNVFDQDISNWNLAGLNINTALDGFMFGKTGATAYSTTNYDALLIGWNNNKLATANGVANWRTDLRPNFGGAKYTSGGAAAAARAALVSYGWTITDGGVA